MALVSGLYKLAKAVPYIYRLFMAVNDKIIDAQIKKIDVARITFNDQRAALLKAVSKAETNEELMAHSLTLHQLNTGKLQSKNAT